MAEFTLHPQLACDTFLITDFDLCRVLLMNDSQFPWLILVPRINEIREIYELNNNNIRQLNKESLFVSKQLMKHFKGDKLNTGALGNLVPQLHIHHIVRFENDIAWPAPVWGKQAAKPYTKEALEKNIAELKALLQNFA